MGKTKSKRKKNEKKVNRSCISGRVINGRDSILVSEIMDYLKINNIEVIQNE